MQAVLASLLVTYTASAQMVLEFGDPVSLEPASEFQVGLDETYTIGVLVNNLGSLERVSGYTLELSIGGGGPPLGGTAVPVFTGADLVTGTPFASDHATPVINGGPNPFPGLGSVPQYLGLSLTTSSAAVTPEEVGAVTLPSGRTLLATLTVSAGGITTPQAWNLSFVGGGSSTFFNDAYNDILKPSLQSSTISVVPEPAARAWTVGWGLAYFGLWRRRMRLPRNCKAIRHRLAIMVLIGLSLAVAAPEAATMSDAFSGRPVLSGASVALDGNSNSATPEIGEPNHDGNRRRTVWGAWTAPGDGQVVIDTIGSSFDTVLSVYVGSTLSNLLAVARNRDMADSDFSRVVFPTKANVTYSIAVDGQNANSSGYGAVNVNVKFTAMVQPGAKVGADNFASRPALTSGAAALGVCNTRFFGLDLFEPPRISDRNYTAWWRWIAPGNGTVVIDTLGSNFDTVLTIYTGSALADLSEVAASVDVVNGEQSQVTFQTLSGQEYQIMVDGQFANTSGFGNAVVGLAWTANALPGAVPGSNSFAGRGKLAGSNAEGIAMNWLFDSEAFESDHGSNRRNTAWWEWTAPADGPVRIRTEGSDFNTHLVVYRGSALTSLQMVASNDDIPNGLWSNVEYIARRGQAYAIMVDGHFANSSGIGNIRLRVDQGISPGETLAVYPAAEVELPGTAGVHYQLQSSDNLIDWKNVGQPLRGEGVPIRVLDALRGTSKRFYRSQTIP